jgi:hypothetical protein
MQQWESADAENYDVWDRSSWWQNKDTGATAWWNSTWSSQDWAEDNTWKQNGSGSELENNREQHDDIDDTRDVVCTPTTECTIPEAFVASPSRRQTTSCKHWLQGRCQWSTKCRFKHEHDTPWENANEAEPANENSDGAHFVSPMTKEQPRNEVVDSVETVQEVTKVKTRPRRPPARLWCQILLHKQHSGFDLIPMLIGRAGCHMREIHAETRAKVRIRGRGSGYLEFDGKREATEPLMLEVTADKAERE